MGHVLPTPPRATPWLAQTPSARLLLCDGGNSLGIPKFLLLEMRWLPGLQGGVWADGRNGLELGWGLPAVGGELPMGQQPRVGAALRGARPQALVGRGLWLQVFWWLFLWREIWNWDFNKKGILKHKEEAATIGLPSLLTEY